MATRAALLACLTLAVMAVAAHAEAVDWLDTQKVRAAYHYGRPPVVARIEKLQQVGINCMILKCGTDKALKWLPEAKKRGMHTFLALNFNVKAADRGFRRAVLDRGETEAYACPLDARFWQEYLTPAVMDRVNLSVDPRYGASGLWIDFELYSTTTGQRYYTRACYCEHCFGRFCQNAGVTTPGLERKERWKWLKEQGYDDRYQPFLQTRIERLATALAFRGHNTSIAMTSASSSFGAWYAFGPAAFAPVEVAPKPALKLLDESRIGPGTASGHMTLQAFVLLGDTFSQERAPVAHDLHHVTVRVQGIGLAPAHAIWGHCTQFGQNRASRTPPVAATTTHSQRGRSQPTTCRLSCTDEHGSMGPLWPGPCASSSCRLFFNSRRAPVFSLSAGLPVRHFTGTRRTQSRFRPMPQSFSSRSTCSPGWRSTRMAFPLSWR